MFHSIITKESQLPRKDAAPQPLENSTTTTLYDYYKTTSIKDNTHDKYKTTKNANMLTIIWLQYMCENWYLILMVLLTHNWYLPQRNSSNYSTKNVTHFFNTGIQSKDHLKRSTLTTTLKTPPTLEEFQMIKGTIFTFLSKSHFKSDLILIGGARTRRTQRKTRTLHKLAFSFYRHKAHQRSG